MILCAKSSHCCTSVSIFANHAVHIVPEVSRDYYPPTTHGYEFDDLFEKRNRYPMGINLLLPSSEMANG